MENEESNDKSIILREILQCLVEIRFLEKNRISLKPSVCWLYLEFMKYSSRKHIFVAVVIVAIGLTITGKDVVALAEMILGTN